jgi:hypothetical protein
VTAKVDRDRKDENRGDIDQQSHGEVGDRKAFVGHDEHSANAT